MMKVNGISLIAAGRLGVVAVIGLALHVAANFRSRDNRPKCPACAQRIGPGNEVYMHRGLTMCRSCTGFHRS